MSPDVLERLERLLAGARKLADAAHPLGRAARERLTRSSGLSSENVDWALTHALEANPSRAELESLAASVTAAPRSHVLLSANVFVAAHRAIALALAASAEVVVRPSRREPSMCELLNEAAPGSFTIAPTLAPRPGEHLFAYGAANTLSEVAQQTPPGVIFHGHGPGFGAVVLNVEAASDLGRARSLAEALALDISAFDQRGCLSPRVLLFEGLRERALAFAAQLAEAIEQREARVPSGTTTREELAEMARYRDTLTFAGDLFPAARGAVGVAPSDSAFELAPTARSLHVIACADPSALLRPIADAVTTFAHVGPPASLARVRSALPHAREAKLGRMQTPAFDGPVDRRPASQARVL